MSDEHKQSALAPLERKIDSLAASFAERFGTLGGRVGSLEGRMESMDGRMSSMDGRMGSMEDMMTWMMQTLDRRFGDIDRRFDELNALIHMQREEWHSEFRALREEQKDQGGRVSVLEDRVDLADQRIVRLESRAS